MPYTVYMPRVTQYIRDEDINKWNQIENKSQWIHEHLNHGMEKVTHKYQKPDFGSSREPSKKPKTPKNDYVPPTTYKNTNDWGA